MHCGLYRRGKEKGWGEGWGGAAKLSRPFLIGVIILRFYAHFKLRDHRNLVFTMSEIIDVHVLANA